jgi:hypothetical protein
LSRRGQNADAIDQVNETNQCGKCPGGVTAGGIVSEPADQAPYEHNQAHQSSNYPAHPENAHPDLGYDRPGN